jgi:hypothetical protein
VTRDYSGIGSKHYKATVEAAASLDPAGFNFMLYYESLVGGRSEAAEAFAKRGASASRAPSILPD